MTGCTVLPSINSVSKHAALQTQRITRAEKDLFELESIDVLLRLNNRWLSDHLVDNLRAQAELNQQYKFHRLKLDFGRQTILLNALVDISDGLDHIVSASLTGEILPDFSGKQLEWFPLIHEFK